MSENSNSFDAWCIVELFGHSQIAGKVTEQQIGGESFVRVDVPQTESQPEFTKFFGSGAIYAITPTTEDVVRQAIRSLSVRPVQLWIVPDHVRELPEPDMEGYEDGPGF